MRPIRIVERTPNGRGDLFARLLTDLFLALGYDNARLNIHKAGREIDIEAVHRVESRRLVAECKAESDSVGGSAINKFVGSLDAERRRSKVPVVGYFVSLSGFTQTAVQQERDLEDSRVVLLDGQRVVQELVKGHVVVPLERAMECAGRHAKYIDAIIHHTEAELLAHQLGWIWAIYYKTHAETTHVALIHADGAILSRRLTAEVIADDQKAGGSLHTLTSIVPSDEAPELEGSLQLARRTYLKYLEEECGDIQLEGLPADQEVGIRRLNLESYLSQI